MGEREEAGSGKRNSAIYRHAAHKAFSNFAVFYHFLYDFIIIILAILVHILVSATT